MKCGQSSRDGNYQLKLNMLDGMVKDHLFAAFFFIEGNLNTAKYLVLLYDSVAVALGSGKIYVSDCPASTL